MYIYIYIYIALPNKVLLQCFGGAKFPKGKSQLVTFVVFVFVVLCVCCGSFCGTLPSKTLQNSGPLHQFYAGKIQDKNLDLLHFCSFCAARWVFAVVCSLRCVGLLLCPRLAQSFVKQCPVTHFLRGQNSQKNKSQLVRFTVVFVFLCNQRLSAN